MHKSYVLALYLLFLLSVSLYGKEASDPDTLWVNGREMYLEGKGWENTELFYDRLPLKAKGTVREPVWNLARNSAGLSLRFESDADTIYIRWELTSKNLSMPHMPATGVSGIDLYMKNEGVWRFTGNGRPSSASFSIAAFKVPDTLKQKREFLLYLPLYNGIKDIQIGCRKNFTIYRIDRKTAGIKPAVFYGTSITQGGCASRPGLAFTSILSRKLDIPVINLGFSGNGQMEPEMAALVSELDASAFVIDCMRNMTTELVKQRAEQFISTIRSHHPEVPIILLEESDIRPVFPTERGKLLYTIYSKMRAAGDINVYFFPGNDLLGNDSEGTVDGIHPNDLGFYRHAEVLRSMLEPLLKGSAQQTKGK